MEDVTAPLLSYTTWRAEAARISELSQRIAKDDRLAPLLRAVISQGSALGSPASAGTAPSPAPTSSSFFSQLFSSSSSAAAAVAQPTLPRCALLAQLLSLAELPAVNGAPTPSAGEVTSAGRASGRVASTAASAVSASLSPPILAHRRFVEIIAAIASSGDSGSHNNNKNSTNAGAYADRESSAGEGHSLVSLSHAVLPMRVASKSSASTSPTAGSPALKSSSSGGCGGNPHASLAATRQAQQPTPFYDVDRVDADDDDDDGGFDRMFAQLKQQAAERRQAPPRSKSATAPAVSPASAVNISPGAAEEVSVVDAGLTAARAALDAVELLLLRVRQQNQLGTSAVGRLTEAQTLVLRATVCREAQLYTAGITTVVQTLLEQHHQAQMEEANRSASGGGDAPRNVFMGEVGQRQTPGGKKGDSGGGGALPWAASVSASAAQLNCLVRCELLHGMSSQLLDASSASPYPAPLRTHAFNERSLTSPPFISSSGSIPVGPHLKNETTAATTGRSAVIGGTAFATVSPTSASSASFYRVPYTPSATPHSQQPSLSPSATSAAPPTSDYLLSAEVVTALRRWTQLVETQQRALRCEEVQDYVRAGYLFLGAAVERVQFSSSNNTGSSSSLPADAKPFFPPRSINDAPSAELASHGVTHLLRACGLLLEDPFLEQEIPYPEALLREVEVLLAKTSASAAAGDAAGAEGSKTMVMVMPPPLRATPHASRVWMLLAQLALFLEHHCLLLPWDIAATPRDPVSTSRPPAVAHTAAAGTTAASTIQLLWEVASAVLLFHPADALRAMHAAVAHTCGVPASAPANATNPVGASSPPGSTTTAPAVHTSLQELFRAYTQDPAPTLATTGLPTAALPKPSQAVVVQPGALPLCLLSLRRASAAAVQARHYAEALRDAEVALYLLRPQPLLTADQAGEAAEDDTRVGSVVDYNRVAFWPAAAALSSRATTSSHDAPSPFFTRTSSCLRAVADNFDARLHFHLLRVLVLLLASPLTAGDAAAVLIRHGDVAWSSLSPLPTRSGAMPQSPAVSTPVRDVAATLRQTLCMLRSMAEQLRCVEQEGWLLSDCTSSPVPAATAAPAAATAAVGAEKQLKPPVESGAAAYLIPYVPCAAHRLSTVLRRAAGAERQASPDLGEGGVTSVKPNAAVGKAGEAAAVTPSDSAPMTSSEAAPLPRARKCGITSSARYQLLKHKFEQQPQQQQQQQRRQTTEKGNEAALSEVSDGKPLTDNAAPPSNSVSTNAGKQQPQQQRANPVGDAGKKGQQDPHAAAEDEAAEGAGSDSMGVVTSAAIEELHRLLCELLTHMYFLTLPLRATSTCTTVTSETALPVTRSSVVSATTSPTADYDHTFPSEGDYDRAYAQSRAALNTFAAGLDRCLRCLGARDRVFIVLLRRLQMELLFPAVCGPLHPSLAR